MIFPRDSPKAETIIIFPHKGTPDPSYRGPQKVCGHMELKEIVHLL